MANYYNSYGQQPPAPPQQHAQTCKLLSFAAFFIRVALLPTPFFFSWRFPCMHYKNWGTLGASGLTQPCGMVRETHHRPVAR